MFYNYGQHYKIESKKPRTKTKKYKTSRSKVVRRNSQDLEWMSKENYGMKIGYAYPRTKHSED